MLWLHRMNDIDDVVTKDINLSGAWPTKSKGILAVFKHSICPEKGNKNVDFDKRASGYKNGS